ERPITEEQLVHGGMKLLIEAPMTRTVREVKVKVGDHVELGTHLVTVEAMKMEHRLVAEGAGLVEEVRAHVEERVDMGQLLVRLSPSGGSE
ncbi:MAG TPA: acetyl-CoA carboxylase biotin carboxyl carrier protein subunit, partial [Planctomycetota bacterium]|nr:acetyl-CoA carboxylase biotin carboxyl carrier protein subunit [Planctomycetota bacterium]